MAYSQSQSWVPSSEGLLQNFQEPNIGRLWGFKVNFMPNGPFGKDWIYGSWLDSDSLTRSVGYREGGRWVHLPFHTTGSQFCTDIVQYGDTMYIGGLFRDLVLDKDSTFISLATIIKVHKDSIWTAPYILNSIRDFEVSGDSLFAWADYYLNLDTSFGGPHLMTVNGGASWNYPYVIPHPTEPTGDFGTEANLEIRDGDIYSLNDATPGHYNGVVKWDGLQWTGFGNGIKGTFSKAFDFTFFRNELYMSGSFTKKEDPQNPGEFIAKWNGTDWQNVGGGLNNGVFDIFVHNDVLYSFSASDTFGDARIPYLAGWDGYQWCGTPITYSGAFPQSFGFINDTLFLSYSLMPATANGTSLSYINYFDGDYLHGPNAICSTPGLGLEESEQKPTIQVYPNPAKDVLNVELPVGNETYSYELYSMDGRLLQKGVLDKEENQIKINKCVSGLCVLKVIGEREVVSLKVAVER